MFPMSMHTAQPVVADRRHQAEATAARHRRGRSLAARRDSPITGSSPAASWLRSSLGAFRRPLRGTRRGAVA